jgi:hypothetical protein
MKKFNFHAALLLMILLATTSYAGRIVVENADSTWTLSPEQPKDVDINTRVIMDKANTTNHKDLFDVPAEVKTTLSQIKPRIIIQDANTTFWLDLIPMNPPIINITFVIGSNSVDLAWARARLSDYPGVLIVYSQDMILWEPVDEVRYQMGNIFAGNVIVAFVGKGDSVTIPSLSPGVTYYFTIFAYTDGWKYSAGNYISLTTVKTPSTTWVWPGDTDNNGLVDERDVLPIGIYWNKVGLSRKSASLAWVGQEVEFWNPVTAAYADSDGNGVVDERDVLPIGINWNKTHEVPQGAPSIDVASIDHSRNLDAYRAIIAGLGDLPNDEAAAEIRVFLQDIISLNESEMIPKENSLLSNYPNPFNPETWIPFELASDSKVTIEIHDVNGRLIRKLDLGNLQAGVYRSKQLAAYWNGKTETGEMAASGVYFCTIRANGFSAVRKMILIK